VSYGEPLFTGGPGTGTRHLHLAWYGYEVCHDPDCTRGQADPADDADCGDPGCEGDCEAARHNAARRARLADSEISAALRLLDG
jgi:hypothetical protein